MSIGTRQTVIAGGGPGDYLEARHVVLRGTNREIGRAIAEIALTEFDSRPVRAIDPIGGTGLRRAPPKEAESPNARIVSRDVGRRALTRLQELCPTWRGATYIALALELDGARRQA
jgi:hypothetical protein